MTVTTRDREILYEIHKEELDALRSLIVLFPDSWREVFECEARNWRAKANGTPESSDARREYLGHAVAHELLLTEDRHV